MTKFQINDSSLESQWRALILLGKNSATYKFALAKCLLDCVEKEKTVISLSELADPFSKYIIDHIQTNNKQGGSNSSKFLDTIRDYIAGKIPEEILLTNTERLGFVNVIDAFQILNGISIPKPFFEKSYSNGKKEIVLTDNLLSLKESFHFQNLNIEAEARWRLVETAWNLEINPNLLEVQYDIENEMLFLESSLMKRKDITSVRNSLNGYQKGKCFYSFQDISIVPHSENLCQIDHFLPHLNKRSHLPSNINGVWNLVLASRAANSDKRAKVPSLEYLERLFKRNEFYVESKHPLAETIINQTGRSSLQRRLFLESHYNIALTNSLHVWRPLVELPATF